MPIRGIRELIIVFGLLSLPLFAFPESQLYRPNEVIIRLKKEPAERIAKLSDREAKDAVSYLAKDSGINVEEIVILSKIGGVYLIRSHDQSVEELMQRFTGNEWIDCVEPNYLRKIKAVPDDFSYHDLWGLDRIRAKEAWDLDFGIKEVVVALVDTGIDWTHEDLARNLWRNPGEIPDDGIDNDSNGFVDDVHGINAWSIVQGGGAVSDIMDFHGHGTHIAGIIGAVGNNAKGVVGVNWKVKLLGCKVGYERFDAAALIMCLDYISKLKDRGIDIRVVNFSAGGLFYSQSEKALISELKARGILFVAAAGNDGKNLDYYPYYPCSYELDNIICVASTDRQENLSTFSNYGSKVQVAAPGEETWSTCSYLTSDDGFILSGYPALEGSSRAYFFDFDMGTQGFSFTGLAGLSIRECYSCPYSVSDSPVSNYPNNADLRITSPTLNLSPYRGFKTFITAMVKPYVAYGEEVRLEASKDGGSNWVPLVILEDSDLFTHYGQWTGLRIGIPSDLKTPNFKFQFRLLTDSKLNDDGLYWDDISIAVVTQETNRYRKLAGTSLAAPFVTGLTSLIWSREPWLTYEEVKKRVIETVDYLPQLSGKVASSGRINAERALRNATYLFSDVPVDHWAYTYVGMLKYTNISYGYGDGTYRPENKLTRAELAAFLVRALFGENFDYYTAPYFQDVNPSMWSFKYVQKLYEKGLTKGCGKGDYCPENLATRAEIAAMLVRALSGEEFTYNETPYFPDVDQTHWAFRYIQKAKELDLIQGYQDGSYKPDSPLSRAEMAVFIYRAFLKQK